MGPPRGVVLKVDDADKATPVETAQQIGDTTDALVLIAQSNYVERAGIDRIG